VTFDEEDSYLSWAVTPCPFRLPSGRSCQLTTRHRTDHFAVWQNDEGAAEVESVPQELPRRLREGEQKVGRGELHK
jgi:hypothetical protein